MAGQSIESASAIQDHRNPFLPHVFVRLPEASRWTIRVVSLALARKYNKWGHPSVVPNQILAD